MYTRIKAANPATRALVVTIAIVATTSIGALVYAHIRIQELTANVQKLSLDIASTTHALSDRTEALRGDLITLDARAAGLDNSLASATQEIRTTQNNVESVRSQVGGVAATVGTLEKLTKIDPELLQKYSKVFFLNEHYTPERVTEIDKIYLYSEAHPEVIHAYVWTHLKNMLDAAGAASVNLYIKSAYRSFDEQKSLKSIYSVTYGAGTANTFSADQGYSEHQLGTAIDFITGGLSGRLDGFDKTTAYKWMKENAYRYGFVLSYPLNNKYYVYEPWHWRYVGVRLAEYLHNGNKNFYDLDQREIDAYLADLF